MNAPLISAVVPVYNAAPFVCDVVEVRWPELADCAFQLGLAAWKSWSNSVMHRVLLRDDLRLFIRALRQDLVCPFRQP
jgi:hypothetical protein